MNIITIKKNAGLVLIGILPLIFFSLMTMFGWGLIYSSIAAAVGLLLSILLFNLVFFKHPIISMIEGKGILVLTIDSTGIIQPYIARVNTPFISFKNKNKKVTSIFDRKTISYMKTPKTANITQKQKDNKKIITVEIDPTKENEYIFSFSSFPVFIYNSNLDAFISKDDLSKLEMNSSIKHMVFYLKKKTEELTSVMRDFARYVIEMSKPRQQFKFLSSWWFWIIVLVLLGLAAVFLFPNLFGSHGVNPITAGQNTIQKLVQ